MVGWVGGCIDGFAYYRLALVFTDHQFNKYLCEYLLCIGPCACCDVEGNIGRGRGLTLRSHVSAHNPCQKCSKRNTPVMGILELASV